MKSKKLKIKRQMRVRAKIRGTAQRPRLSVFRSNKAIYAQLIDDQQGKTLVAVREREIKKEGTKAEKAGWVGEILAEKAKKIKINKVVFERGAYRYHGRVKSLAEGARKGGLKF
ncbi:MAG: 50S ribosomal protein L18 [Candidatus Marinimicrobia bacterium]|nr:50S ribosomal protein L18 [Candidatus Neomarinimicrobiota bacterium]